MRRFGGRDLRLPPGLREEMRTPVGALVQTEGLTKAISGSRFVASVGDVCTGALLSLGIVPKVSVVDGQTKRGPWEGGGVGRGQSIVRVKNPAETITAELWRAVEAAYGAPGNTVIVVDGEEDLASLACIHLAPEGTTVIYGVPNRGVMVIRVDAAIRARTEGVLAKME